MCSSVGVLFNTTPLKIQQTDGGTQTVSCSAPSQNGHSMKCDFSALDQKTKQMKTKVVDLAYIPMDGGDALLSNQSKNIIIQIKGNSAVFHERLLLNSGSLEKICLGTVQKH